MARLTPAQQLFVMDRLAEFSTLQAVADALKEEFGVEISRQGIDWYRPERNPKLSEPLRARFAEHRRTWLQDLDEISLRHRKVRLRELEKLYEEATTWRRSRTAKVGKNEYAWIEEMELDSARAIIRQIAEEVGDLKGEGLSVGVNVQVELNDRFAKMSDAELHETESSLAEHLTGSL